MIHKQKSFHRRIVRSNRQNKNLISEHQVLRNQTNNLYSQLKKNLPTSAAELQELPSPFLEGNQPYHW